MKKVLLLLLFVGVVFAKDIFSEGGRYELLQLNDVRSDQYLLDTKLGRIWRVVLVPRDPNDKSENLKEEDGFTVFSAIPFWDGALKPAPAGAKNYNGRYKLGQLSIARRDQFLLDTATGRVWVFVVDELGRILLESRMFIDGTLQPKDE